VNGTPFVIFTQVFNPFFLDPLCKDFLQSLPFSNIQVVFLIPADHVVNGIPQDWKKTGLEGCRYKKDYKSSAKIFILLNSRLTTTAKSIAAKGFIRSL
jgi:hypothetical protein